jgi:selenocysteine lyase/cysteine desulfurase
VIVRRAPGEGWTDAVLAAMNQSVAVVSVPNCHWTDGAVLDLGRIGAAARDAGAALVIDASQSFGAFPIDVKRVRPDFLVSVGYKWQHGPYGISYLYAAPRWREEGVPIEHSWMTRAGAEDFAGLTTPVDRYRPGARRFDMGEFPQMITLPMAAAGLEQIAAWGVERIQATLSAATRLIGDAAREGGLEVTPPDRRVGHFLGVRGTPEHIGGLQERLRAANIRVAARGDSLRISPHLHNSAEDIENLCALLARRDA